MFCTRCGSPADGSFCPRCGAPVGAAAPPLPPPLPAPGLRFDYASWGSRAVGYILDRLLVALLIIPLALLFVLFAGASHLMSPFAWHHGPPAGFCCVLGVFPVAGLLVGLWNKVYLVSKRGSSLGQGAMDIMVVDAQGRLVSQGTALLRLVAHTAMGFVPFLSMIDLLWPLWDDRRQTLHDKVANTYVIRRPTS